MGRQEWSSMFTSERINKRIIAALVLAACLAGMLGILSGCQTNSEMKSELTPAVSDASTLTSGTLTVGVNASNSPYAGQNSSGETVGFDIDVAAAIADELGLKLQVVDVNSNGRAALTDKKVDVAMGLMKSGNVDNVTYSSAYINDGATLFVLEGNEPESVTAVDVSQGKFLVQGETTAASIVQSVFGADSIQASSSMSDAFKALEDGEQPYLVADAVIGSYFARDYENIVSAGFIGADCVVPIYAVTLTENSELSVAVERALSTITQNGVLRTIEAKWLGTQGASLLPGQVDLSTLPQTTFGK